MPTPLPEEEAKVEVKPEATPAAPTSTEAVKH